MSRHRWTSASSVSLGVLSTLLELDQKNFTNDSNLMFRVNNGIPNLITETALPFQIRRRVRYDAPYVQEQWTQGRMTLQGALRFDHAWSYFPEQTIGPSNYLPFSTAFPRTEGVVGYKDLSPRGGFAYDLFGTGKTSLKINVGKYLEPASNNNGSYSISDPNGRIATTVTRAWIDGNQNFRPDCDLVNGLAQDNRPSGGDFCNAINDLNFGKPVYSNTIDPAILAGWSIRPNDWGVGVSIQQELVSRVSVEVGYFRRQFGNFIATDNRALAVSDFTQFSIAAPPDSRLPGGGNYTVSNLYNVTQAGFLRPPDNFITDAAAYGEEYQRYQGVLINFSVRPRNGLTFQGGVNTGKTVQDNCAIRNQVPELTTLAVGSLVWPVVNPTNPFCHSDPGLITRVTGFGSYIVPKVDVQISGTLRSDQGGVLAANWNASNNDLQSALGRPIAGGLPNLSINLVEPGQVWGDRVNEIDLRIAKVLRFGKTRTSIGIDVFNVLNSAAVLTYNQTFVPNGTWLQPLSVLTPRFVKIGAQIDF